MIYLVRHGFTDWNEHKNEKGEKDSLLQGRVDIPLNDHGRADAVNLREKIKDIKFDRVFCSPLSRAKETCSIIYNGSVPVVYDERLIERDMGEFEGKSISQVDVNYLCNAKIKQKFEKAETLKQVIDRAYDLLDELSREPDKNILIVSHAGIGCAIISYFEGIPENGDFFKISLKNCEVKILDFCNKI